MGIAREVRPYMRPYSDATCPVPYSGPTSLHCIEELKMGGGPRGGEVSVHVSGGVGAKALAQRQPIRPSGLSVSVSVSVQILEWKAMATGEIEMSSAPPPSENRGPTR